MQENDLVEDTTCFSEHKKRNLPCANKACRQWMDCGQKLNCAIIGAEEGEHTLQEIGDIFGVTRMRVCQMEKIIIKSMGLQRVIKKSS